MLAVTPTSNHNVVLFFALEHFLSFCALAAECCVVSYTRDWVHATSFALLFLASINLVFVSVVVLLVMSVDLLSTGYPFFGVLAVSLYVIISGIWKWIMWLVLALCILIFQTGFSVYQGTRIFLDLVVLAILKLYIRCQKFSGHVFGYDEVTLTRQKMHRATSYEEWLHYAEMLDELTSRSSWRRESDSPVLQKLVTL